MTIDIGTIWNFISRYGLGVSVSVGTVGFMGFVFWRLLAWVMKMVVRLIDAAAAREDKLLKIVEQYARVFDEHNTVTREFREEVKTGSAYARDEHKAIIEGQRANAEAQRTNAAGVTEVLNRLIDRIDNMRSHAA